MNAKNLIGKNAVRTRPACKYGDRSYMDSPILILKVTDDHIIYKHTEKYMNERISVLPYEWCDDNWIDYDELVSLDKTVSDIAEAIISESTHE